MDIFSLPITNVVKKFGKDKEFSNLNKYGKIYIYTGSSNPSLSKGVIEFLGFFVGDGHYYKKGDIFITTSTDIGLMLHYKKLVKPCVDWLYIERKPARNKNWKDELYMRFKSNLFKNIYFSFLENSRSVLTSVDDKILFIRGFLDADGSIIIRGNKISEIKFTNTNTNFINIVKNILSELGVNFSITLDNRFDRKHKKPCYNIRIFGREIEKFIRVVGVAPAALPG